VDDFARTAASMSYRGNIRRLQELFEKLEAKALSLGISFSVAQRELIHWRSPSQRHSLKCHSPIPIKGELFCPRDSVRCLRYWFMPALDSSAHFSHRLALVQGAFALIRRLSPPGAGLTPYLCHRLATSLVAPILFYGADLFTPSAGAMARLNTFWHKVQRWTTNCFSATPTRILSVESLLPLVPLLISQWQRVGALRVVCSPPKVNLATACLHPSFPSLSADRAQDALRALTRGLKSVYLPLHGKTPRATPAIRNPRLIEAVAHKTIPFTSGLSRMPMINSHLASPALAIHPQSLMDNTYATLKKRVREALLEEWAHLFLAPGYYHHSPTANHQPFIGLSKFMAARMYQMRARKRYLAAHPTWRTPEAETSCPRCGLEPETFEHAIRACPCRQGACTYLLHHVMSVGHEAPMWSSLPLLKWLTTYISVTSTGFPPMMFPPTTTALPPRCPSHPFKYLPRRFVSFRWLRVRPGRLSLLRQYVSFHC